MEKKLSALEALEEMRYLVIFNNEDDDCEPQPIKVFVDEICPKQYEMVKYHLKALEIIKEKNVNTFLVCQCKNYIEYNKALANQGVVGARHFNLTKEEFDLLKEILK